MQAGWIWAIPIMDCNNCPLGHSPLNDPHPLFKIRVSCNSIRVSVGARSPLSIYKTQLRLLSTLCALFSQSLNLCSCFRFRVRFRVLGLASLCENPASITDYRCPNPCGHCVWADATAIPSCNLLCTGCLGLISALSSQFLLQSGKFLCCSWKFFKFACFYVFYLKFWFFFSIMCISVCLRMGFEI